MKNLEDSIKELKFDSAGLIPAIIVEAETKQVLMMAWMNSTSIAETVKTKKTHFWSRSRQKYWMKGETSGNVQEVHDIYTDCDADTLVIEVTPKGAACHKGYFSCFYRKLDEDGNWKIIAEKQFDPDKVYEKK